LLVTSRKGVESTFPPRITLILPPCSTMKSRRVSPGGEAT
jgi:hypothetical protein